jgi:hypothetical protein
MQLESKNIMCQLYTNSRLGERQLANNVLLVRNFRLAFALRRRLLTSLTRPTSTACSSHCAMFCRACSPLLASCALFYAMLLPGVGIRSWWFAFLKINSDQYLYINRCPECTWVDTIWVQTHLTSV